MRVCGRRRRGRGGAVGVGPDERGTDSMRSTGVTVSTVTVLRCLPATLTTEETRAHTRTVSLSLSLTSHTFVYMTHIYMYTGLTQIILYLYVIVHTNNLQQSETEKNDEKTIKPVLKCVESA